jgi:[protein-PII] uridylyltransferase
MAELAAGTRVTVVAVGGYGRGELALHSDIDLMLLGSPSDAEARSILYPLWDAHLKVGHSIRTVRQAAAAGRDRVDTLCSLLTGRVVAGDPEPFAELEAELSSILRRERGRFVSVLASEARARRLAEPHHKQVVDVKAGRGALRCFHTADWLRRRAVLTGQTGPEALSGEDEARDVLRAVRNALHAVADRASDVFATERRRAVGSWLGSDPMEVASALYRAVRIGDRLTRSLMAVPAQFDPVAATGRMVVGAIRSPVRAPRSNGSAALAMAAAAASRGVWIPDAGQRAVLADDPVPLWSATDRSNLLSLVGAGSVGWDVLDRLIEAGWVARVLPEWERVIGLAQVAPFHEHPVDAHLWRTVSEVMAVTTPDSAEPWCRQVAEDLGPLDELLLAAVTHDLGKALPGDHSEAGAALAREMLGRLGFGPASVETVATAVRQHLLLPTVATRQDLDDPAVVTTVADRVGDRSSLRLLFLLTVADARATGPESWSPWRASLVRSLFSRTDAEMARRAQGRRGPLEAEVIEAAASEAGVPAVSVARHADGMPDGYLLRFGAAEVARHLRLCDPPPAPGEVKLDVRPGAPLSDVVVAGGDRPHFLATVCGVLALHSVSVRTARVATRSDGLVLDAFTVEDALGTGMIGPARWPSIRTDLSAALRGDLPLAERIRAKVEAYARRRATPPAESATVRVIPASGRRGVVEVRSTDRLGLLYEVCGALAAASLDVHRATVDTLAGQAIDVFHVDGLPEDVDELRLRLEDHLAGGVN